MKPKRIKALKQHITAQDNVFNESYDCTEPCYVLRQSDVRAAIEQVAFKITGCFFDHDKSIERGTAEAFRQLGITPGRARKGTR